MSSRLLTITLVAACGGKITNAPPTESFCELVGTGKLNAASTVAHAALLSGPRGPLVPGAAPETHDDGHVLGLWLQRQACVASVTVSTGLIETMPPIREILFVLQPDANGVVRACTAELVRTPDDRLGIHPRDSVTGGKGPVDPRCTPVGASS